VRGQKRKPLYQTAVSFFVGSLLEAMLRVLRGLHVFVVPSGRGKPRPYKGTRQIGDLVGAHLCVRPFTKAACVQRADTSVGPYRGNKVVLYFGGVASVGCAQRAGHAPPLQKRKERHMALRLVYISYFYAQNYAYSGSGPAGPVREGGMESRGSGGPVQGPPILWP